MKYDKEVVLGLIQKYTSISPNNYGLGLILGNNRVVIKKDLLKADFYFIAVEKQSKNTIELLDNKIHVYVLKKNNFEFGEEYKSDYTIFDLNYCDLLHEQNRDVVYNTKNTGDDLAFDKLTMRDYACILLKVPESSKIWLNNLIIKSTK